MSGSFATLGFMPHGYCYLWLRELLLLHILSDGLIALAYYSIPVALVYFVRRRTDLGFSWVLLLFAAFILACGTTHAMEVWTIWEPDYWLAGSIKAVTAAVSLGTAAILWIRMPLFLALPSQAQLRHANEALRQEVAKHRQTLAVLEEAEARFHNAFDYAAIGMALVAPDGRWLKVNPALCNLVGYAESDLLARTFSAVTHPEDLDLDVQYVQELLAGERFSYHIEKRYVHKTGQLVWVCLSHSLVRRSDGSPFYFVVQIQDITEQKCAEQALLQANAELETRVTARTQALAEADRCKDEFLAMLGHELRNPLAPIRNAVELLKLQPALLAASAQWVRELLDRQVAYMTRLLDDLLDVSRISQGKITLKKVPVVLADVIAHAIETAKPLLDDHQHQLTVSLPNESVTLEADPTRLAQAVTNLLNNAAKYTEDDGRIWLTAQQEGNNVVLTVQDTGVGISADLLPRVFDLFTQGKQSLARSKGGLGLGLTLVRQLIELHGGQVQAFSDGPGRGSKFIIRLPTLTDEQRVPTVPSSAQQSLGKPRTYRILIAEDNVDLAQSLAMLLSTLGHSVQTVYNGRAALDAAGIFQPEVVFLDIGLPAMNGYEVARRLRSQRQQTAVHPHLVALTGYGQEEDVQRAKAAGFDRHLLKPVTLAQLRTLLETLELS